MPKKLAVKAKEFAFEKGDFVVYPTHGVGRVVDIEAKEIAGHKLGLFVISFEQERMMLRVPVAKAKISGLRKLSSRKIMENALVNLKVRSRVTRAMWNRRAQEYEAKINSGDPVSIAEVVRDLHRNANQPDQSYSERQISPRSRPRPPGPRAGRRRAHRQGFGDPEAEQRPHQGRVTPGSARTNPKGGRPRVEPPFFALAVTRLGPFARPFGQRGEAQHLVLVTGW